MPKLDYQIQDKIAKLVIERDLKEREDRIESGRLTASMLGWPLQWQILKMIGVPQSPKDEYTLRKFQRGRDVEDWLMKIVGASDLQKKIQYKEVTGKIDGSYDFGEGKIPVEVKSVANAKFKWIKNRRSADLPHLLQGTLYALAEGCNSYALVYVASDDYRTLTFVCEASQHASEVDDIIDEVDKCFNQGIVPEFKPYSEATKWQANPQYNNYPEWSELKLPEIMDKLTKEYPESFLQLTKRGVGV